MPDANRLAVSAGAGFKLADNITLDVAYMFIYGLQRQVSGSTFGFDGIYNSWAHIGSVGVNFKF